MSLRERGGDNTEPNGTVKDKDLEKNSNSSNDFEQNKPFEKASLADRIAHFTW